MHPVTEQHEWLKQGVGTWQVKCQYFVEEGAPPMEAKGEDRVDMVGSFWRESFFSADVLGSQTDGRMIIGYDPTQRCFVGNWCDSSNPFFYSYTGQLDENKRSLELVGNNIDNCGDNSDEGKTEESNIICSN